MIEVEGVSSEARFAQPAIAEQVFRRILALIKEGVLKPGQALPSERELAETMGVGRPSLREALRALALHGVLDIRKREGIFVKALDLGSLLEPLRVHLAIDARSLDDLFEARVVFEPSMTELAAARIESDEIAALRSCLERGAAAMDDADEFVRIDEEFHELIAAACRNTFLQKIAQSFWELGAASREITVRLPGVLRRSHDDHDRIFASLVRRDPTAAAEAMRTHLYNVRTAFHLSKLELRHPSEPETAAPGSEVSWRGKE